MHRHICFKTQNIDTAMGHKCFHLDCAFLLKEKMLNKRHILPPNLLRQIDGSARQLSSEVNCDKIDSARRCLHIQCS